MPVAVLLTTWAMQLAPVNLKVLGNVAIIVLGIIIASYGEIAFVFIGFMFQAAGIVFESLRLAMVQKILSSPEYKMDPLVSLYYFAPVNKLATGLIEDLCGNECNLLYYFRRTKLEFTSYPGCRSNHALHERSGSFLS